MRSALFLGLLGLAGCEHAFETSDHEYDFPPSAYSAPAPGATTNVQPKRPAPGPSYTFDPYAGATGKVAYVEIAASDHYTCGIRSNQQVDCWGDAPANAPSFLKEISIGPKTACGVDPNGVLHCWGAAEGFEAPIGEELTKVGVGDGFACALDPKRHPHCWGPKAIAAPAEETLEELAVGTDHACGLHADGTAVCWGTGAAAQPPRAMHFYGLAAGPATTCALVTGSREAYCWGLLAGAFGGDLERLSVTMGKACGVRASDDELECWGLSGSTDWLRPPAVPLLRVSIGTTHACGLRRGDGLAICWGSDTSGESRAP